MLLWGGGSNCQSPAQQNIYASVTWQRCAADVGARSHGGAPKLPPMQQRLRLEWTFPLAEQMLEV